MTPPNQQAMDSAVKALKAVLPKITPERREFNKRFLLKWSAIFSAENATKLKADDVASFTAFSENQHWSGIHRQNGAITADLLLLRKTVSALLDETRSISDRIDEVDPLRGQKPVKGLGKAVYTAILAVAYSDKYPVMNSKSRECLKHFGLLTTRRADPSSKRYEELTERCRALAESVGCSLLELDELFHHTLEAMGAKVDDDQSDLDVEAENTSARVWVIAAGGKRFEMGRLPVAEHDCDRLGQAW